MAAAASFTPDLKGSTPEASGPSTPNGAGTQPDIGTDCDDDHCECPPASGKVPRTPLTLTEVDRTRLAKLSSALGAGHHGVLHLSTEAGFQSFTRLFNRAIVSPAIAVVRPLDTTGVSLAVATAYEAGWSVSVKGGGYGTNGWAAQGDMVIDLSRLNDVAVHIPNEETGRVDPPPFCTDPFDANYADGILDEITGGKRRSAQEAFGLKDRGGRPRSRSRSAGGSAGETRSKRPAREAATGMVDGKGTDEDADSSSDSHPSGGGLEERETLRLPPNVSRSVSAPEAQNAKLSPSGDLRSLPSIAAGGGPATGHERTSASEPVPTPPAGASGTATAEGPSGLATPASGRATPTSTTPSSADVSAELPKGVKGESTAANGSGAASFSAGAISTPTGWTPPSDVLWHGGPPPIAPDGLLSGMISPGVAAGPSGSSFATSVLSPRSMATAMDAFREVDPAAMPSTSSIISPRTRHHLLRPAARRIDAAGPDMPAVNGSATTGILDDVPALVTFGCGIKTKDLAEKTSKWGYYVPSSAFPVGGASFSTGGFGFLSRLCGLSMDNVVAAEIVLASGRVVHLGENPEPGSEEERLWWAFRGAGTALGVVTRVRCKAFKVGLVYAANIIYPFNPATTPSLMRHWRDCLKNVPAELYANFILTAGPTSTSSVIVLQLCFFGPQSEGDWFVSALTSWEGERPLLQDVGLCTMLSQLDKVALVLDTNAASHSSNRWCIRSDIMTSLTDQTIFDTCKMFRNIPPRSAWIFEIAGQAVAEIAPEASCYPQSNRAAPFTVAAIHQWPEESEDKAWRDAAQVWIDDTISPHSPGGPYPCFLETRTEKARFVKTFGGVQNWKRLKSIKREVDPHGMFKWTLWPESDSDKLEKATAAAAC